MSEPQEDPDVRAMSRLRAGEDLALNEIMDRWRERLMSYLLRLTGDDAIALDLAQETFVRVYQHRDRYRPTGAFSSWLFAIATNLARHHFRWRMRHRSISIDAPSGERPPVGEPCRLPIRTRAIAWRRQKGQMPCARLSLSFPRIFEKRLSCSNMRRCPTKRSPRSNVAR
jgi:RNA polymerase sigma factor (sigma-70 family)